MDLFNELEKVNEEISSTISQSDYLLSNMPDIAQLSENYLKEANETYTPGGTGINSTSITQIIRGDAIDLQRKLLSLRRKREEIIKTILNSSIFTVAEVIDLMDAFGAYYKEEDIGITTLLVPQDFALIRNGNHSIISEEEMDGIAFDYTSSVAAKKSAYSMSMYKKSDNGIILNDELLTAVAGVEVSDIGAIQLYVRNGNSVEFNGEMLNIFPYDVLAFLEVFISERWSNPNLKVKETVKEYLKASESLKFSSDDPALEDLYRTKKRN